MKRLVVLALVLSAGTLVASGCASSTRPVRSACPAAMRTFHGATGLVATADECAPLGGRTLKVWHYSESSGCDASAYFDVTRDGTPEFRNLVCE